MRVKKSLSQFLRPIIIARDGYFFLPSPLVASPRNFYEFLLRWLRDYIPGAKGSRWCDQSRNSFMDHPIQKLYARPARQRTKNARYENLRNLRNSRTRDANQNPRISLSLFLPLLKIKKKIPMEQSAIPNLVVCLISASYLIRGSATIVPLKSSLKWRLRVCAFAHNAARHFSLYSDMYALYTPLTDLRFGKNGDGWPCGIWHVWLGEDLPRRRRSDDLVRDVGIGEVI